MHIFSETLTFVRLSVKFSSTVCVLIFKASLSHSQVIYDKAKISIHFSKVNNLTFHPGYVFMQLLDLGLSWANISFQFLDLIIKDKFEFFQFLSLFLEFNDTIFFVMNRCLTLIEFCFLWLNLSFQISSSIDHLLKSIFCFFSLLVKLSFFFFFFSSFTMHSG